MTSHVGNGSVAVDGLDRQAMGAEDADDQARIVVRKNSYDTAMKNGLPSTKKSSMDGKAEVADCAPAPLTGWRRLLPFVPGGDRKNVHDYPMLMAGWLSLVSFHWSTAMMWKGFRGTLELTDLWKIHPDDSAAVTGGKLKEKWNEQLAVAKGDVQKARLGRAFLGAFGKGLVVGFFGMFMYQVLQFLSSSIFIFQLVRFTEMPAAETDTAWGVFLACMFLLNEMVRAVCFSFSWYFGVQAAIRFRAALNMIVFDKVMRLRNLGKMTVGQVVNLCVNDGQRLFECALFTAFLVGAPTMSIAVLVYTTILIGWPAVLGCVVFLMFYPIQGAFGKRIGLYRRLAVKETDVRVRKMNEILNCVKLIKMYAWESPFAEQIAAVRQKERTHLQRSAMFTALTFAITPVVPLAATAVAFSAKTLTGGSLTASEAFSILASFTAMRFSLAVLPFGVRGVSEALVAFPRLKALLEMPELVPISSALEHPDNSIELRGTTFAWDARLATEKEKPKPSKAERRESRKHLQPATSEGDGAEEEEVAVPDCLVDLSLSVRKGELIGVCGAFGSGKSSLLSALLGGMNIRNGTVALKGSVAYVSQQAWIINASLRDNVLFGSAFDEEKYNRVIGAAALVKDLEILPDGDQTEIGERGINLSGGQKQRVSLARALYAERDVYLLDDPLSAVDAHVGSHIFNELIKKELSGRTVLLVTHQLQYLPMCDRVLMLVGGRIAEEGSYADMIANKGEFQLLMKQYMEEESEIAEEDDGADAEIAKKVLEVLKIAEDVESVQRQISAISTHSGDGRSATVSPAGWRRKKKKKHGSKASEPPADKATGQPLKLIQAEDRAVGSVSWSAYRAFIKAGGGAFVALFLVLITLAVVAVSIGSSWWLTYWLRQGDGNSTTNSTMSRQEDLSQNPRLDFFVGIFYALFFALAVVAITRGILFMQIMLRASSNLHNYVFKRVFRAPMSFFDTTPTGRILNRFSKDLDEIDTQLPWLASNSLLNVFTMIASVLVATVVYPILLAPLAVVALVFMLLEAIYVRAVRDLKRLENISRSPLISHLGSSIQGLTTIHAFKKNEEFTTNFKSMLDQNTVCLQSFQAGARWIALRLDLLATVLIFFTALMLVLNKENVNPALGGLALTYIVQIGGLLQFTVRTVAETQARFTSVERINHYATKIPVEADEHTKRSTPLPSDWPSNGELTFESVEMRYREGTPLVLHGLNFNVKSQEKVGVIGRTGAGKSSLAVCLLRLVEVESGRICIDGIDISSVGLNDLRSRISIIPQDPVLFVGTIRYNLDPFNRHSDEEVDRALEQTHLKETIDALADGLQTEVLENGENFSVGERQLMCMARALLRHSKVLILDEATASIDSETDALIQKTIRECFADCTLLTIAHRLNTVLDSDRLMVMDEGRVAEFDTPARLLTNPESLFTKMLTASRESKEE